ncbi:hypothetical protein SPAR_31081 [Streptomyces sparsogenes DSM 40356]|uniref:Uncharacterized protein n=1 Tax=Streptomyces sparsogenes DSM 40356 TaxID=1331668 RepID=A0A1R1SBB4_9ACTN|nr:hypothetical protein SPAR_31081 [Streptomyces sparsogenes DSM 40356]
MLCAEAELRLRLDAAGADRQPRLVEVCPDGGSHDGELRGQAQLLARIVHVLEIENSKLKETHAALEQQAAARASVPDLTRRRRRP